MSKNIKVIDEHSIDRDANVLFGVDVDGSEYVVYWIERDNDNDNIFVSKILKNIDGTSSMLNIEDTMEKNKISDIVKELVKYAVDNENNSLGNKFISLPSGKDVEIIDVTINKEQNINVQKTYITTVKKAVTKVGNDYFVVSDVAPAAAPEPVVEAPVAPPVTDMFPSASVGDTLTPVLGDVVPSIVEPVIEPVVPEPVVMPAVELPIPEAPVVAPAPVPPTIESPVAPEPVVELPMPEVPVVAPAPVAPTIESPVTPEPAVELPIPEVPVVAPAPVAPTIEPPVAPEPAVELPISEAPVVSDNSLVFDASKESNLSDVFGGSSDNATIPVENVGTIREFGVDETPLVPPVVAPAPSADQASLNTLNQEQLQSSGGFANNKFFMVIAITFFLASCVFLGYEVFNYFQVK